MRNVTFISPNKMQPASSFRLSGLEGSPSQSQLGPLARSCEGPERGVSGDAVHLGRGQRVLSGVLATLLFSLWAPMVPRRGRRTATSVPGLGLGCVTGWGLVSPGARGLSPRSPQLPSLTWSGDSPYPSQQPFYPEDRGSHKPTRWISEKPNVGLSCWR